MTLLHFETIPIRELADPLVDLSAYPFVLEPVYFQQGLSGELHMFLRKTVAEKLLKIQQTLGSYRFKIWDGFRPREVQNALYQKFWNELQAQHPEWDEEKLKTEVGIFVTDAKNPKRIPPHTTGGTVDLTLVDGAGRELAMGTVFDHFGPEAAAYYFEEHAGNDAARKNRKILREAMAAEGFSVDPDEWWHFDFGNQKWAVETDQPEAFFGEASL